MRPHRPKDLDLQNRETHQLKHSQGVLAYINVVNLNDHPIWVYFYDNDLWTESAADQQEVVCHFSLFCEAHSQWKQDFATPVEFDHAIAIESAKDEDDKPYKNPVFLQVLFR